MCRGAPVRVPGEVCKATRTDCLLSEFQSEETGAAGSPLVSDRRTRQSRGGGEGRLTHARPTGDDDELAGSIAQNDSVQLGQAGGYARLVLEAVRDTLRTREHVD